MPNRSLSRRSRSARERARERDGVPKKRERDVLLGALCHDLRAPLAAITMGANFVLQSTRKTDTNARSIRILEAMIRSCGQMERLIRNFADIAEIEGHSVELRLGLHDAGEILERAAAAAREAAAARAIRVNIRKPEAPLTVKVDRERILRALGHLIDNAAKDAPEESAVTLAVTAHDGMTSFSVSGQGSPISPEHTRDIFDLDWQATRPDRATGFGLAIAHGFVDAHGGRIEVESRPDEATTFTIVVPDGGPRH